MDGKEHSASLFPFWYFFTTLLFIKEELFLNMFYKQNKNNLKQYIADISK